jgi:hypothetical protein
MTAEQQKDVLKGSAYSFPLDFWTSLPHRLSYDELVRHAEVDRIENLPEDKWPTMSWDQVFDLSPLVREQAISFQKTPLTFQDYRHAAQRSISLKNANPDVCPKLSVEQVCELGVAGHMLPAQGLPQDLTASDVKRLGYRVLELAGKVTFAATPLSVEDVKELGYLSAYFPRACLPQVCTLAECRQLGWKVTCLPDSAFSSLSEIEIDTLSTYVREAIRKKRGAC